MSSSTAYAGGWRRGKKEPHMVANHRAWQLSGMRRLTDVTLRVVLAHGDTGMLFQAEARRAAWTSYGDLAQKELARKHEGLRAEVDHSPLSFMCCPDSPFLLWSFHLADCYSLFKGQPNICIELDSSWSLFTYIVSAIPCKRYAFPFHSQGL